MPDPAGLERPGISYRGFFRFWVAWLPQAAALVGVGVAAAIAGGILVRALASSSTVLATVAGALLLAAAVPVGVILLGVSFLLAIHYAWPQPGRTWWN